MNVTLIKRFYKEILWHSFLFFSTLFIYHYVLLMEECEKKPNKSKDTKKGIFILLCQCFDLRASARLVQEGKEWPGSKSLESARGGAGLASFGFSSVFGALV